MIEIVGDGPKLYKMYRSQPATRYPLPATRYPLPATRYPPVKDTP